MENLAWIVVPEEDSIATVKIDISKLVENEKLLSKSPKWIHFRSLNNQVEDFLIKQFNINELSLEDCHSEARSKVEVFENYVFILIIYFDGGISRQKRLCIFWGKSSIVTVGSRRLFEETRKELSLKEKPFEHGTEEVFWLVSAIVANKFRHITGMLEEQADEIEASVFRKQNPELLEDISDLSFEIITLRRVLKQLRDAYESIISSLPHFIIPKNIHYFRDSFDEISILYDRTEALDEFVRNVLNIFSSLLDFKLNDIMKVLTIFVTVLEVPMFITSFYGMNVKGLPFAHSRFGIFLISFVMLGISAAFLYYFRKRRWI